MSVRKLVVVTAPSGTGKTTIVKRLLADKPVLQFSISAATRAPRGSEVDGVDYYFLSIETFQQRIEEDAFAEYEMVYEGKYYGTLRSELDRIWDAGSIPLVDIDVKGALKIWEQYPQALCIFIKPPSIEVLKARLEGRGTDSAAAIAERVAKSTYELSFAPQFKHVVVNDVLEEAVSQIKALVSHYLESQ
jgi:guanylate kinase